MPPSSPPPSEPPSDPGQRLAVSNGASGAAGSTGSAKAKRASGSKQRRSKKRPPPSQDAPLLEFSGELFDESRHLKHIEVRAYKPGTRLTPDLAKTALCVTITPTLPTDTREVLVGIAGILSHKFLQSLRMDVQMDAAKALHDTFDVELPSLRTLVWYGSGEHDSTAMGWVKGKGPQPMLPSTDKWITGVKAVVKGTKSIRHIRVTQMNPPCEKSNGSSVTDLVNAICDPSDAMKMKLVVLESLHVEGWSARTNAWDPVLMTREMAVRLATAAPNLQALRIDIPMTDLETIHSLFTPFRCLDTIWLGTPRPKSSTSEQHSMDIATTLALHMPRLRNIKIVTYIVAGNAELDVEVEYFSVVEWKLMRGMYDDVIFFDEIGTLDEVDPMLGIDIGWPDEVVQTVMQESVVEVVDAGGDVGEMSVSVQPVAEEDMNADDIEAMFGGDFDGPPELVSQGPVSLPPVIIEPTPIPSPLPAPTQDASPSPIGNRIGGSSPTPSQAKGRIETDEDLLLLQKLYPNNTSTIPQNAPSLKTTEPITSQILPPPRIPTPSTDPIPDNPSLLRKATELDASSRNAKMNLAPDQNSSVFRKMTSVVELNEMLHAVQLDAGRSVQVPVPVAPPRKASNAGSVNADVLKSVRNESNGTVDGGVASRAAVSLDLVEDSGYSSAMESEQWTGGNMGVMPMLSHPSLAFDFSLLRKAVFVPDYADQTDLTADPTTETAASVPATVVQKIASEEQTSVVESRAVQLDAVKPIAPPRKASNAVSVGLNSDVLSPVRKVSDAKSEVGAGDREATSLAVSDSILSNPSLAIDFSMLRKAEVVPGVVDKTTLVVDTPADSASVSAASVPPTVVESVPAGVTQMIASTDADKVKSWEDIYVDNIAIPDDPVIEDDSETQDNGGGWSCFSFCSGRRAAV